MWGKGFAAKRKSTGKGNQHRCPIEGASCDAMWASGLSRGGTDRQEGGTEMTRQAEARSQRAQEAVVLRLCCGLKTPGEFCGSGGGAVF